MFRPAVALLVTSTIVASGVFAPSAGAHPGPLASVTSAPPPTLSSHGDYATDAFGDPWDFSNDEDVPPISLVGTEGDRGILRTAQGQLVVATVNGTNIKLVRTWGIQLPWGRDGQLHPVDAAAYTRLSFSMCTPQQLNMGIHFWTDTGAQGLMPIYPEAGCRQFTYDLTDLSKYPFPGLQAPWAGKVVRLDLLRGGPVAGGDPVLDISFDWVRLHRADASATPDTGAPMPVVLEPDVEGGADYATLAGNPWDFTGPDDIVSTIDLANLSFAGGDLSGQTVGNDGVVELPLRAPLLTDRYHRATVDVCYGGGMSFADAPGGGMNARFAWFPRSGWAWTETQDIIIYPGCNRMTVDLSTDPPVAVNDENTLIKTGWRGLSVDRFRFDLNEDPGVRNFVLREIRLADDDAFASTFPIRFRDNANTPGATADLYVTTRKGAFDGTTIARGVPVSGLTTFTWNGTDERGVPLPNDTYWVYVVMRNASGVGTGFSTGPVRLERPIPDTPSNYVSLPPVRILDTRDGTGGNIWPLGPAATTEVDVTGVGGVPSTGVTAVVMNVTVDQPSNSGYLSVWPSGEGRPLVSNLNFSPGQTVPNLVTVKVGANGRVNVFNPFGYAHVIADVVGYYTTAKVPSGKFTAVSPSRALDTRDGTGAPAGPVVGGTSIDVGVVGTAGVPASGVSAVAINVTVDQPTGNGFLTVWPTGQPRPLASSHNFTPGLTVANLVIAKVGAGGKVSIFNSTGTTHVVGDVIGYFSDQGGQFVPVSPQRLLDTRDSTGGIAGPVWGQWTISPGVGGVGPVPPDAGAAVVNVTSVNDDVGYVTVWPSGVARPLASTLNPRPGVAVPNQAYLKLGSAGRLDAFNLVGANQLIIDVFGYFR